MALKLAQLADLKAAMVITGNGQDAVLRDLLLAAAGMFERAAGCARGDLCRQVDRVEYPQGRPAPTSRLVTIQLAGRPIESISEVVQLYARSSDTQFDDAVANGVGVLTEGTDFYVDSATFGRLGRFNTHWLAGPRCIRVTATSGWADPDDAVGGDAIEPPADVQRANLMQAVLLFNLQSTAGLRGVEAGGASGKVGDAEIHPMVVQVARNYRSDA